MKIDNDLMDGGWLREATEGEDFIINKVKMDNMHEFVYSDLEQAFLLGRQYERNITKNNQIKEKGE